MGSQSRSLINVICGLLVFGTNLFISFWLSPFIIKNIGIEANGFVSLANNFVMYAGLITMALNSMSSRFIAMAYIEQDYNKANLYYNSVFWGRVIIAICLLGPAAYLIAQLDTIVNVPNDLLVDVKLLFFFVFSMFFVGSCLPNWDCGTYITNRLDRSYLPTLATSLLRVALIFLLMTVLVPKVWYLGAVSLFTSLIGIVIAYYNTKVLTPELGIIFSRKNRICSWSAMFELISSGIWNTISMVGNMLLSGLDLIVCNIFLGPTLMGVVALSKTLPSIVQNLSGTVRGAFGAELTINYAKGNMDAVYRDLNRAMKMTSFIMLVPIAIIVVFGDVFFSLWVPQQDAHLLQILSVLAIIGYMFTSGTQILYNVFSTVNKVKANSIAMILSGVVSILITLLMVKCTNLGVYAVAGVSTFVNLVRNMSFTLPASAIYLGFKWTRFFPQVFQTVISSIVLIVVGYLIKPYLLFENWFYLICSISIYTIVCFIINWSILLSRIERDIIKEKILNKIRKLSIC